jgi:hypothetical protein
MLFGSAGLVFAVDRWNGNRRLDDHGNWRRRDNDGRACSGHRPRRGPGDHCTCGWSRRNGRRCRRCNNDRRRRARLRHDFAWLRAGWLRSRSSSRYARRLGRRGAGRRCNGRRLCAHWRVALTRLLLFFKLAGQNGLRRVAGLGDTREIGLGLNALRGTRRCGAALAARPRGALILRANLICLEILQRTGVGLAAGQAELRQYVKNLPTLDFHLACEIVDSNLTHPPLFKMCRQKPLSRS